MKTLTAIFGMALLTGCTGMGFFEDATANNNLVEWSLTADENLGLRDPTGKQARAYPNPLECEQLDVALNRDGELRGRCLKDGLVAQRLEGNSGGIPFIARFDYGPEGLNGKVNDMYGVTHFQLTNLPDACATISIDDSHSCQVCSDDNGAVDVTDCQEMITELAEDMQNDPGSLMDAEICIDLDLEGYETCSVCHSADGMTRSPSCDQIESDIRDAIAENIDAGEESCWPIDQAGGGTCTVCGGPDGVTTEGDCDDIIPIMNFDPETIADDPPADDPPADEPTNDCFEAGAQAYLDALNDVLAEEGVPEAPIGVEDVEERGFGFDMCGFSFGGDMAGMMGGLMPMVADDGTLNCAMAGNAAMGAVCDAVTEGCDGSADFGKGISAASMAWNDFSHSNTGFGFDFGNMFASDEPDGSEGAEVPEGGEVPEEFPLCRGDPLVLDLENDGISLTSVENGPLFDLYATGKRTRTAWVNSGAWLTVDLNMNGAVDTGAELFGDTMVLPSGLRANDGFSALAVYDRMEMGGNEDGQVDHGDAIFPLLGLWTDANNNGKSDPGETVAPVDAGVASIDLEYEKAWVPSDSVNGNVAGTKASFTFTDGSVGNVYDVWLDFIILRDNS